MKFQHYAARPQFVITDGMSQSEVDAHLFSHVVRQPRHIIWCETCDCYRREGHDCEQPALIRENDADPPPGCPEGE